MAVAPLSLRTEDPGLSGVLGMAKVAASGTHLAEARSQSAQGFRVFSFSVRISIFSFLSLTVWSTFLFHWISLWIDCTSCQGLLCLSCKLDKLFVGRFLWDTFWGMLFERRKFILICRNTRPEMISFDEIHPDLQEMSERDDFQRRNSSWLAGNVCGGWFPTGKLILICLKSLWGMISNEEKHPDLQEMSEKDDFQRRNSSWFDKNIWEGCIEEKRHLQTSPASTNKKRARLSFLFACFQFLLRT